MPLSSQLVLGPARESEPAELGGRHRLMEMGGVVEVTYLTWTEGNLLRQVSYQGQRQDKPARQVVRPVPYPQGRNKGAPLNQIVFIKCPNADHDILKVVVTARRRQILEADQHFQAAGRDTGQDMVSSVRIERRN